MSEQVAISRTDVALALGLWAVGVFEMVTTRVDGWGYGVGVETLAAALLVSRRRWPLVVPTLVPVVLFSMPWFGPQLDEAAAPILFVAVAVYTLARWIPDYRGLAGLAVILLAALVDYTGADTRVHNWGDVVFMLSLVAPPYVVGRVARQAADRADLLQRNQDLVRRDAIRDERDRIARELHDVIAHSVSAMVVQTAAAQDLVRLDPDRAASVLADVADTGRRALVETGRLLHVLRDEDDEMGLGPAPGVDQVPALVDAFRASGLDVALDVEEPLPALPPGLDVSVYRIVQEALTNALKHGAGRSAAVRLSSTADALAIDASNPVPVEPGERTDAVGSGLGLLGMRERVHLLGGRLTHGCDGGAFRLSVTVPLTAEGV